MQDRLRETVMKLATQRLGPPNPHDIEALMAVEGLDQLKMLLERALVARNWQELLADVAPPHFN